jgi:hypothetical protein
VTAAGADDVTVAGGVDVTIGVDARGGTFVGGGARRGGSGTCSVFCASRFVLALELESGNCPDGALPGGVEQPARTMKRPMTILPGVNTPAL